MQISWFPPNLVTLRYRVQTRYMRLLMNICFDFKTNQKYKHLVITNLKTSLKLTCLLHTKSEVVGQILCIEITNNDCRAQNVAIFHDNDQVCTQQKQLFQPTHYFTGKWWIRKIIELFVCCWYKYIDYIQHVFGFKTRAKD